jgi:hypothetical protein
MQGKPEVVIAQFDDVGVDGVLFRSARRIGMHGHKTLAFD